MQPLYGYWTKDWNGNWYWVNTMTQGTSPLLFTEAPETIVYAGATYKKIDESELEKAELKRLRAKYPKG